MRPQYTQHPSQSSLRDATRQYPAPPPMNRLGSSPSQHERQGSRNISGGGSISSQAHHRSRPSRDREMLSDRSKGYEDRLQPNSTATSEVVVPNKSRLREEEIEVPYARDSQLMDARRSSSRAESRNSIGRESPNSSIPDRARTPRDNRAIPTDTLSPAATDDREYYDRMSFSSNLTNKSKPGQPTGWDGERERKIRAEYEFRIAGLERRTAIAETEREEAKRNETGERDRRKEWEEEVRGLKEVRASSPGSFRYTDGGKRAATHASSLRSIQHELDIARDAAETARKHSEQASNSAQEEISQWRDRCDGLEDDLRRMEDEKAASDSNGSSGVGLTSSSLGVTDICAGRPSRCRVEERDPLPSRRAERPFSAQ